MRIDSVDAAGITASNYVTAGGGTAGLIGFLSQINWFGLAGLLVALIGLVANVYFQIRRDRREALESQARIEALRERCNL